MPPLSCAGGGTTLPLSPFPKPLPDWRCTAPPLLNWPGGGTTAPSPNPPIARCSSEPPPNCAGGGTICLCSSPEPKPGRSEERRVGKDCRERCGIAYDEDKSEA